MYAIRLDGLAANFQALKLTMLLLICGLLAACIGCDGASPANASDSIKADIAAAMSVGTLAPADSAPVGPDEKVPRAKCTECKGTGTITAGDGHRVPCGNCYAATKAACVCGDDCKCEDCPGDCVGESAPLGALTPAVLLNPVSRNCNSRDCESDSFAMLDPISCSYSTGGSCQQDQCGPSGECGSNTAPAAGGCKDGACGSSSGSGGGYSGPGHRVAKVGKAAARVLTAPFRLFCRRCR